MIVLSDAEKLNTIKKLCKGFDYELFQDQTLMENARIGAEHYKIDISRCTPTFILKVDDSFLAVIVQGSRKLDFKKLKKYLGTSKVRMAAPDEIFELTGALIGSVSMINPNLRTLIDQNIRNLDYCYGGCGVEKCTLRISSKDLVQVTQAELEDFSVERP